MIIEVKQDRFREHPLKTKMVKLAIEDVLKSYGVEEPKADYVLEIVKNQKDY